ncbi:hypothetical protein G6F31_017974 [Rhizopus arrhizus]|nr:hypothetical protein G6F31_017974 [Rhizopus arrhizus]
MPIRTPCPVRPAACAARALVTARCASKAGSCGLAGGGVVGGGVVGGGVVGGGSMRTLPPPPPPPHAVSAIASAVPRADLTIVVRSIDSFP